MITKILTGLRCPTDDTHVWAQSRTWLPWELRSIMLQHPLGGLLSGRELSTLRAPATCQEKHSPSSLQPTSGSCQGSHYCCSRSAREQPGLQPEGSAGRWWCLGSHAGPRVQACLSVWRHRAHHSASCSAAQAVKSRKSTCPANGWD